MATATPLVTYSPALTMVPTYECFNRCSYCNFRVDPPEAAWLSLASAEKRLAIAQSQEVIEILVLSGEVHPHSPRRSQWLQRIYRLCALAVRMGFLPHTNVGPLTVAEMAQLQSVNVSMGLMLEQATPRLMEGVHRHAPSKQPALRLQQLEQAGRLKIPFTTGLLLGIGEQERDRLDSLGAIAASHKRWGHIQEVILQPHQPGESQANQLEPFSADDLVRFVKTAREILPHEIAIQIPPNLIFSPSHLLAAIANGAEDLGGLSPVDEVNPDYPHPTPDALRACLKPTGRQLQPRLPVYPEYDAWVSRPLQSLVAQWRCRLAGASASTHRGVPSEERDRRFLRTA